MGRFGVLNYLYGSINQGHLRLIYTIDYWYFEVAVIRCHSTLQAVLYSILRSGLIQKYFANFIFMYLLLRLSCAKGCSNLIFDCALSISAIFALFVDCDLTAVVGIVLD